MDVRFVPVETAEDQEALAKLAGEIWHEYWPALIGAAQTDYMVEQFQNLEAIKRDMAENAYEYWFVVDEAGKTVGYTGGHEEPETSRYFISKIYLLTEERGKHYASKIIEFYVELCHSRDLHAMYLTVNLTVSAIARLLARRRGQRQDPVQATVDANSTSTI